MSGRNIRGWIKVWITGFAIVGTGVLCFKYTTPTPEELLTKFSPELREQYYQNRDRRQAEHEELMRLIKQTSSSNEPAWKTGYLESPMEARNGRAIRQMEKEREEARERIKARVEELRREREAAEAAAEAAAAANGKSGN